jgi:hypothetical protein
MGDPWAISARYQDIAEKELRVCKARGRHLAVIWASPPTYIGPGPWARAQKRSSVQISLTVVLGRLGKPGPQRLAPLSRRATPVVLILAAFKPEQLGSDVSVDDDAVGPFLTTAQQIPIGKLILIEPESELLHL